MKGLGGMLPEPSDSKHGSISQAEIHHNEEIIPLSAGELYLDKFYYFNVFSLYNTGVIGIRLAPKCFSFPVGFFSLCNRNS